MNNHELDKCLRIINDLVIYCHAHGGEKYEISLENIENTHFINVSSRVQSFSPEKLARFKEKLKVFRQRETENYFWEVGGGPAKSDDLALVGMMLDVAKVKYEDGILRIYAERHI